MLAAVTVKAVAGVLQRATEGATSKVKAFPVHNEIKPVMWGVIRDLHAVRKITVILVTHDLREAVFLADRVFVMSSRPGRIIAERKVEFPRPRDLEVTFTAEFQAVVHELREHIVRARG